jgi:hypothetical protein
MGNGNNVINLKYPTHWSTAIIPPSRSGGGGGGYYILGIINISLESTVNYYWHYQLKIK